MKLGIWMASIHCGIQFAYPNLRIATSFLRKLRRFHFAALFCLALVCMFDTQACSATAALSIVRALFFHLGKTMANTMSSPEVAIREGETHEVTPETPAAVDLTVSEPGAATQSGDASRIRKGSAVLANFPFEGEEAHSVSNARLKELQLCDTELSQEFFQRTTLQALKEEVCRWHKSGDLIEKDLMTIDNLVEELRTKACNQDTGESDTFMSEGPLKGKALVEVLRVQHASRWRLQQVRDGESLFSYCYFTKYVGLGDATMPESTSNLQELQREGVLDVVKWVVNRMSDTAKCSPAVGRGWCRIFRKRI